ncbi:class II glutamine amidotransferase [soil metagenome]
MCRLFGLHAGFARVTASFWLTDAPDSLSAQSRRNPDGFGMGTFAPDGTPVVDKAPLTAWRQSEFAVAAHSLEGTTFVAHVRHASTGALTKVNTHPFLQRGRLFAHNGIIADLGRLDARLRDLGADALVRGQTDSERFFALITAETERLGGDVAAGIRSAVVWVCAELPVFSVNFVLTTPTDLWALRLPRANSLYVLDRVAGGGGTSRSLRADGSYLSAKSEPLNDQAAVVVASEMMDDDPGWRELAAGELLHVDQALTCESTLVPAVTHWDQGTPPGAGAPGSG